LRAGAKHESIDRRAVFGLEAAGEGPRRIVADGEITLGKPGNGGRGEQESRNAERVRKPLAAPPGC